MSREPLPRFGWKGCLGILAGIVAGWLIIIGIGYAILRGILSFLSLYED